MKIEYRKSDKALWFIFIILILIIPSLSIIQNWRIDNLGAGIFFYASFLAFLLYFFLQLIKVHTSLEIYLEGILISRLYRKSVFLEWSEVSAVRGGFWTRGIRLANEDRSIKIHFDPEIKDFSYLVEALRIFRPALWKVDTPIMFHKSPFLLVLFIGASIFFPIWGGNLILDDGNYVGLLFIVVGIGSGIALFLTPWRVTIQGEALLLTYFLRKQTIHANEVVNVVTYGQPMLPFMNFATLELRLKNNKTVDLSWFNSPSIFYAFLMTWFKKTSRKKLKDGWLMLDKPVKIPSIADSKQKHLASGE